MCHRLLALLLPALLLSATPVYAGSEEKTVTLPIPPASLEEWYKPANKRQVWLHTMFRLRRSMQAVTQYSALEDRELLTKWAGKLVKDYNSIGDMVPEWRDELETEWAERLLAAAEALDKPVIERALFRLGKSCTGCHREYRAITAALYRTPDFSVVTVEDQETLEDMSYEDTMEGLSISLNRIVIALADQDIKAAKSARQKLVSRLDNLAGSCASCHKDEASREQILGNTNKGKLEKLGTLLEAGDIKESRHAVGDIAVSICARCHGTHRTLSDLREFIVKSE